MVPNLGSILAQLLLGLDMVLGHRIEPIFPGPEILLIGPKLDSAQFLLGLLFYWAALFGFLGLESHI